MRRMLLVLVGSAIVATPLEGQRAGLLLGVGGFESRTVWIDVSGDTVRVRSGVGIIVPRKAGFWRVGVGRPPAAYPELRDSALKLDRADSAARAAMGTDTVTAQAEEQVGVPADDEGTNVMGEPIGHEICFLAGPWAAPLGGWPAIHYPKCGERDHGGGDVHYTFVGADHVSGWLEQAGEYTYQYGRGSFLGSLDTLAARGIMAVDDVLGGAPRPANAALHARELKRCGRQWMTEFNNWEPGEEELVTDDRGVAIVRGAGRWEYVALFAKTSGAGRGSDFHCVMQVPIANVVTSGGRLAVPLAAIRKRVPDAIDAFSSPDGRTLIVLAKRELMVFRSEGGRIGRQLGAAAWEPLLGQYATGYEDPSRTIMSQWATGRGAERWSRELAPLLPDVAPVVAGTRASEGKVKR